MIDEAKIRERAYELWELADKPDGAEQEHWHQALEQLRAEQQPAFASTLDSASGTSESGNARMPVDE